MAEPDAKTSSAVQASSRSRFLRIVAVALIAVVLGVLVLDSLTRRHGLPGLSELGVPLVSTSSDPALPVFAYPKRDRKNRPCALFVDRGPERWVISVLFPDEDHPFFLADRGYDLLRLFALFKRVADIEDVVLESPYSAARVLVFPRTYAGDQAYDVWTATHETARLPQEAFESDQGRPKIYINTWNHLFSERPGSPSLEYQTDPEIPVFQANRRSLDEAFRHYFSCRWSLRD